MEMWSGWGNKEIEEKEGFVGDGGQKGGTGEESECSVKNNTH